MNKTRSLVSIKSSQYSVFFFFISGGDDSTEHCSVHKGQTEIPTKLQVLKQNSDSNGICHTF